MGRGNIDMAVQELQRALLAVFSWLVLTAVGVIISGKLLANRMPLNLGGEDLFSINLFLFRLKATGAEVSLGLASFLLVLGLVVTFGGVPAYEFFRVQTGLDVGQWNSLCAIASFFSIVLAIVIWIAAAFFTPTPLISTSERERQIRLLQERDGSGGNR